MSLYCVRCRLSTPTTGLTTIITKNKRRALTGKCVKCGTQKYKFISMSDSGTKIGGDIAASLGKLPGLPWARYVGVKHFLDIIIVVLELDLISDSMIKIKQDPESIQ